jgi:hypothetical protein
MGEAVTYRYVLLSEILSLVVAPRKSHLGEIHDKLGTEVYIGEYMKFRCVAVNYDHMEVSDKAVKQQ